MAMLIAQKNKAAGAINGEASSDGLNAMLGSDDADLQTMLIESIKKGKVLKGSTEEWTAEASDRAREILAGIGKKKQKVLTPKDQFVAWVNQHIETDSSKNVLIRKSSTITSHIEQGKINGFSFVNQVLEVDLIEAFGIDCIQDGEMVAYLTEYERKIVAAEEQISLFEIKAEDKVKTKKKRTAPVTGQLAFELF
ncbi:hypothetical protein ACFFHF_17255 [Robertmurraya beringensis]|uniref:Uncharacterized protein n=1 Tax=Robertmurraya beringensis TaxID=641660 RepID=A0ABV6KUK2_9BACI